MAQVQKLNELELKRGVPLSASWHAQYMRSPWVYIGGLPYELTEGDVICVFSQYGEVEYIHLLRTPDTGKSMGSAFLKYEDPRSCVLAVDNLNGIEVRAWCRRPASRVSCRAVAGLRAAVQHLLFAAASAVLVLCPVRVRGCVVRRTVS